MMTHSGLNEEQQRAVDFGQGALLVLAGAGSGKTRIVTHRIAQLIESGVNPSSVLAVTFTNKAAQEMRERVQQLCHHKVLVSTFHSLGARLLRESIQHLGFKQDFTIYDEDDSLKLLKSCAEKVGLDGKKATIKSLKGQISDCKNRLIAPDEVEVDPREAEIYRLMPKVYEDYQQRLAEYNGVDFDDLLFLPVRLFREHPKVLEMYQKRWKYLLVDEYQDTNEAQYEFVKLLVGPNGNLCVVGDPDQSIYSWRGANIENILNFERDFPGARVIKLEQNYRSTSSILEAANAVIENNSDRYEKTLWSELGEGEKIHLYFAESEYDEADFVVDRVQKHQEDGLRLEEMVIFYRTNFQSRQFEDTLLRRRIPYVIVGGISFYQRKEIKDILAWLRLVQSDADFVSFSRVVNLPKRGIGAASIEKMRLWAQERALPILALLRELPQGFKLSAKQRKGIDEFLGVIEQLRRDKDEQSFREFVKSAIERTGYLGVLREDETTFEDRKQNLQELVSKAAEWDDEGVEDPLTSFLEELSLKSSLDEAAASEDQLRLMTLHNGKGLEFPVVFMVGMEEELLPHANARGSFSALEEERRLCYVGMTRARRMLYMSNAESRSIWGQHRLMRPSRFIGEIPDKYCEIMKQVDSIEFVDDAAEESDELFCEGTAVYHPQFGVGVIERVYEGGMGMTYQIAFQKDRSQRVLVARFANLTVLKA